MLLLNFKFNKSFLNNFIIKPVGVTTKKNIKAMIIGELILPTLTDKSVSTPRLEELFWHRLVVGGQEMDIYSQINEARIVWPNDEDLTKSHSGAILKSLISNGKLVD